MSLRPETRGEKVVRWYKLHVRGSLRQWALAGGLFVALVAAWFGVGAALGRLGGWVDRSSWWQALSPSARFLLMGTSLEGTGVFFLVRRWKRRVAIRSLLDLRVFVGEIVLIVAGGTMLAKAAGFL